ncbi:exopolysaccharide biosynthesis polyprenyl glycosylphosphotransferase [Synechococcus sp. CCY 9618]|uniref:exopolysaccharide biosynthesis polyprenyl glycosylphosphotransferase n=1 Tax=Synechococcus sp. CCY 9618 TaxID=2815602 RepID=UPI0020B1ABB9|nr:exopolysaccharide biosynthesis polyprenyl glycosylphosphotransferase [Synechococcus sp. CCY 9618]
MWWRAPWLRQRWLLMGLAIFDAILLLGLYNLLYWRQTEQWVGLTRSIGLLIAFWVASSYLMGRYSRPEPGQGLAESRRLIDTALVALLVLGVVVILLNWGLQVKDPRTFRGFLIPLLAGATLGSGLAQLWASRRQQRSRSWLLVGDGDELGTLEQELARERDRHRLDLHYCPTEALLTAPGDITDKIGGIAVSETADMRDGLLQDLLARRARGGSFCTLVVWAEQHLQRVPPELFSSRWLVQAEGFELQPGRWGWRLKRFGDLLVASQLLILSAPLLLIAALLIRLEDRGPVFYGQLRTGLYGRPITVWKLRTMRQGAEAGGARWACRDDPRITRIGSWLRRLRIDELPQLLSVLKGEMSLIGPRPERPELEATLETQIRHYRVRHWVRPGLSGWAQVCYPYGASVEDSRMKLSYDLYYMRNASLMLDILILIKTIRLVAGAKGAQPEVPRQVLS